MRTVHLRANKTAVSPVIGTILMVAITVVLAAVLYVMVTGLVTSPGGNKPTLTLTPGQWQDRNLTIQITSVSSSTIKYTDLTFQVQSVAKGICFTGAANTAVQTGCSGVSANVTYSDAAGEGNVDALDIIKVYASPATDVKGGTFKVSLGSDAITQITLPA